MSFKSNPRVRVAIVGGGIAGLSCALALLGRGAAVDVFEAGKAGRGALWASGGMLAGGFECAAHRAPTALAELARESMALWHQWAEALGADRIGFRTKGVLAPASGETGADWLETLLGYAKAHDIAADLTKDLPDGLAARRGVYFPDDGELDNRLFGPVLAAAVRKAGGQIYEHSPVSAIDADRLSLTYAAGEVEADAIILATGHSAGPLNAFAPEFASLKPVKGHMLSVDAADLTLPTCVRAQNVYLSHKADGRLVIGATSEPGRADSDIDPKATADLRDRANRLLPALAGKSELERWCGIRPGTPDDLPMLGSGQASGVFIATGLYRNGVLLAPAVAELLAEAVLTGRNVPAAFAPGRFDAN